MSRFFASIIPGHGRGKTLTVPTINLKPQSGLEIENGVYAVRVHLGTIFYPAVMHVGPRPTFHETDVSLEVHLLDFEGEVLVKEVEVEILGRLRDVKAFDSPEALKKQIEEDMMGARTYFFKQDES